jgi:multidrug efflux pump subunit AcrB
MNDSSSPISWMANNPVAAKLLMVLIFVSGLLSITQIRQEIQPNYTYSTVLIDISYPGASPEEIERSLLMAVEAELEGIEGIAKITGIATEGNARLRADVAHGEDLDRTLQNVQNKIDRITWFPNNVERPIVRLDDDARWLTTIAVNGHIDELALHSLTNTLKSDLLSMNGVIQVSPRIERSSEINIEVPYKTLNALGMTISQVTEKIKDSATTIPSGVLKTDFGELVIRTQGKRTEAPDFENIPIQNGQFGDTLFLKDIANVREQLSSQEAFFSLNGKPGSIIYVYQAKDSRTLELADQVSAYVDSVNASLPKSISLALPYQRAEKFRSRISMLIENGIVGFALVILVLGIFLTPRLAVWIGLSIPVVLIAAFNILVYMDVSINMISVFAFIMTIGLVVDDAIIVGENIYTKYQSGMPISVAASEGANEMFLPVSVAVLTNIIAFIPILMMQGDIGQYMRSLPIVAIAVFMVSYFDALFLLPAHLNSHSGKRNDANAQFLNMKKTSGLFTGVLEHFRDVYYSTALNFCLARRYGVLLFAVGLISVAAVWFETSRIDFRWYPEIPTDRVSASLKMPVGTALKDTLELAKIIEKAGLEALQELGTSFDTISSEISVGVSSANEARVIITLADEEKREYSQQRFSQNWREKVGQVPSAASLTFDFLVGFGRSSGVYLDLSHPSTKIMQQVALELASIITTFEGVFDVSDGLSEGKNLLEIRPSQAAISLGIDETMLGEQLRSAFFGQEAFRFLRNGELVKVWVRLPEIEKNDLALFYDFIIRSPNGTEIPLSHAANIREARTVTNIIRVNGRRIITVGGFLDSQTGNLSLINDVLFNTVIPDMKAKYPGLDIGSTGTLDQTINLSPTNMLLKGFLIACLVMYVVIASLFRSYAQAFVILLTIPFCIAAAIYGHIFMAYTLTSNSLFGMVALSGLVINGSVVLTNKINSLTIQNIKFDIAIVEASISRFRAIILTALTTTIGLLPLLFETSEQALFLVPFAIALTFGSIASIFIVLFITPCCHAISRDLASILKFKQ